MRTVLILIAVLCIFGAVYAVRTALEDEKACDQLGGVLLRTSHGYACLEMKRLK